MSISQNFPEIAPSLNLDFANVKALDPRVTFSRASGATYYGTQTAKAEENLLTYSQEFDNAAWNKQNLTVTANTTAAPDGTTTAEKLVENTANASHRLKRNINVTASTEVVYSVFAKADTRDFIALSPSNPGVANHLTFFDLATGAVGTNAAGNTASIEDVGNGWYRCIVKRTTTSTQTIVDTQIYIASADNTSTYTGDGTSGIFIWGAQLEQRSAVTAYTVTTDQPITRYQPVLESEPAGVARFDHDPITGESLGLLVEEQRTNLFTASESFTTGWTKEQLSVVTNTAIAPDGTLTAAKAVPTTDVQVHVVRQSSPTGNPQALSIYAKQGEYSTLALFFTNHGAYVVFDLSTGTIVDTDGTVTGQITDVGNGFYRCSASTTLTNSSIVRYYVINGSSWDDRTVAGDGFSGIYIWGAQLEAAEFPTSYIKTVASQVTRSADSASMTGANFSSWYRQDEGTLYADVIPSTLTKVQTFIGFTNNSNNNGILLQTFANGNIVYSLRSNNVNSALIEKSGISLGEDIKTSFSYSNAAAGFAVNNDLVGTDTSVIIPVITQLGIGQRWSGLAQIYNGHIKKISYYPKASTSAQLQALTG